MDGVPVEPEATRPLAAGSCAATTSADSSSRSLERRPSSVLRSTATERFPRLSGMKYRPTPGATGITYRYASPAGGSTLITSAPRSARSTPQSGPATYCAYSTTRTPSRGRLIEDRALCAR